MMFYQKSVQRLLNSLETGLFVVHMLWRLLFSLRVFKKKSYKAFSHKHIDKIIYLNKQ